MTDVNLASPEPAFKRKEVIGDIHFEGFAARCAVYAIEGASVVYVGSTTQDIRHRVRAHVADAKKNSSLPIHKWMRDHRFVFKVRLLQWCDADNRVDVERQWISRFSDLLNVTDGGPGMSGHRFAGTEHARRIAEAIETKTKHPCLTCGVVFHRKHSEVVKGHNKYCSRNCSNRREAA
jgi:hypothetical protein